jgi:TusA-related sulfurtransferase
MDGQGMRKAKQDHELKVIKDDEESTNEINEHMKEHPEHDFRIKDGSSLYGKAVYRDKIYRKKKKKRKKRFENYGAIAQF